jgi:hypothetical protein
MENTLTILSTLIAVPFIGFFFALTAKDDETTNGRNVFSVTILTLVSSPRLDNRRKDFMMSAEGEKNGKQNKCHADSG